MKNPWKFTREKGAAMEGSGLVLFCGVGTYVPQGKSHREGRRPHCRQDHVSRGGRTVPKSPSVGRGTECENSRRRRFKRRNHSGCSAGRKPGRGMPGSGLCLRLRCCQAQRQHLRLFLRSLGSTVFPWSPAGWGGLGSSREDAAVSIGESSCHLPAGWDSPRIARYAHP